jgi:hypothetical protein
MAEYTQGRPKSCYTVQCDYIPASERLIVEFSGYKKGLARPPFTGRPYLYVYEDVPQAVWDYWLSIDCDGEWYNYNIRGQPKALGYGYVRIT